MSEALEPLKIGIVGGMGPAASAYFATMLTELAPATRDQDHPVVIHISNSQVPDRTAFLVGQGEDPVPEIAKTIHQLDQVGVDVIAIPCNTAHTPALFDRYKDQTQTPIVHMIRETMRAIDTDYPLARTVAVLGTTGTRRTESFSDEAKGHNFSVVYPEDVDQDRLMSTIHDIKRRGISPEDASTLLDIAAETQADIYVLACTELSMASKALRKLTALPVVDTLECLARRTLHNIDS